MTNAVPTMAIVVTTATIANTVVSMSFISVACTKTINCNAKTLCVEVRSTKKGESMCTLSEGCSRFPILLTVSGLKRFGKLRELQNDTGSNLYGKIRK